jgi:polyhydroxyalkanoate synthesis regulator phasin
MDLLQRQAYNLWFTWLAEKINEWNESKPLNKDLRNCIKALTEIGMFANTLQNEIEIVTKRYHLTREQKNKTINDLKEQIQELENKLKQYDTYGGGIRIL